MPASKRTAAERLAALKAKAAGDPTGGQAAAEQNQAQAQSAVAQLLQQRAQPLEQPQVQTQDDRPAAGTLQAAYQNTLNNKVAQLNQQLSLQAKQQQLANLEEARKGQAGAYRSRMEAELINPDDNGIPDTVKENLVDILGANFTDANAAKNTAKGAISDKDLEKSGWNRDKLNDFIDQYDKPGAYVPPGMDTQVINSAEAASLFGLKPAANLVPVVPGAQPTARPRSGFESDLSGVADFASQALSNPGQNFLPGLRAIGSGAQDAVRNSSQLNSVAKNTRSGLRAVKKYFGL